MKLPLFRVPYGVVLEHTEEYISHHHLQDCEHEVGTGADICRAFLQCEHLWTLPEVHRHGELHPQGFCRAFKSRQVLHHE
jgi:hypothetical protein